MVLLHAWVSVIAVWLQCEQAGMSRWLADSSWEGLGSFLSIRLRRCRCKGETCMRCWRRTTGTSLKVQQPPSHILWYWNACDTDQQIGKLCSSNASQPSGGGCQRAVRWQHIEQGSARRAQSSAAALLLCLASCCVVAELHASCAQS